VTSLLLKRASGLRTAECIAQCLNLEHEFHHTASKLCILGFEPLNKYESMHIRTASWLPSLTCKAQHILSRV
jgi:hypothetical protein